VPDGLTAYYHVLFQPLQQVAGHVDVPWRTCLGQSAEVFFVNSRLRTSTDSGGAYASVAFSITPDSTPAPTVTLMRTTIGPARRNVSLLFRSTGGCWIEFELEGYKQRVVLDDVGGWANLRLPRALKRGKHVLTFMAVSPSGSRGAGQRATIVV
jgi:hypothetical protein